MTDHDRVAARRDIADALLLAFERRHEVLDAIVGQADNTGAVNAIAELLGTSISSSEAVLQLSFDRLTKDSRRKIAAELDDLNSQLSFTLAERPASSGDGLTLRPFDASDDRDIFAARTEDMHAAGDGSGGPASSLEDEISAAQLRIYAEEAAWFVLESDVSNKVGMVFGELAHGELDVRIWISHTHRKLGYGTAALRMSRSEMAALFPAVPLVIRAPAAPPE
ncbi:MAG: GNAT family N-acetyltransferase [Mycobacterium sp.]